MIFVDTSVWYSAFVSNSAEHRACERLVFDCSASLLTTDYVIDELVTLLVGRGLRRVALERVPLLLDPSFCDLVRVTDADFAEAWRLVEQFIDKQWSFTDCTSYAVIERLGITEALSLDDHFRQFGNVKVLP